MSHKADQLFLQQIIEDAMQDAELQTLAVTMTELKFSEAFANRAVDLFVQRNQRNIELFGQWLQTNVVVRNVVVRNQINTAMSREIRDRINDGEVDVC